MPIWKITQVEHDKLVASERHHMVHLNSTSVCGDGSVNIFFSRNVAAMLKQELQIEPMQIINPERPLDHPEDAYILDIVDLERVALNAPGFNEPAGESAPAAETQPEQ